jgi:HPt (histidine-containing phosphotransfer) domain-containing protein
MTTDGGFRASVFSPDVLHEAAGGDSALVAELLLIFLRSVPPRVVRLAEAIAACQASAVARQAHELKSNLALVGARAASDACARIETTARRTGVCPPPGDAAILCGQIACIVEQVEHYHALLASPS